MTVFLKRHGFSPSLTECCGPVFEDYRLWIDLIRPLFMEFSYEDQFHVDELMMYTDFLPAINEKPIDPNKPGSSTDNQPKLAQQYPPDMPRGVTCTLLLASNSSGTEKLRPLICAPYVTFNKRQDCIYHCDENATINDELFGGWLSNLNHEMASVNRRIVVLLSRKRIGALVYTQLTHIMPLFFPNEFPTHLRPLRRDVFHYIKMIYRTKYVEQLCTVSPKIFSQTDDIIETLIDAWHQVPPELIIASFQRTKFREDDSLLSIECPAWDNLKIGMPFKRFVLFDDDLSDVPTFGLDPSFVMSINKSKYSFRDSDNEEISKLNDVEEQSDSSRELETSLKRPSDDSIDISTDITYQGQESMTPDTPEVVDIPRTNPASDSEQFFSARDTDEGHDEENKKKQMDDKSKIEDVLNDMIDSTLDETKTSSPTRGSSTPISKDYDKRLMSRVYPSPERTSTSQQHVTFIADQCFEEVSKCLENKLMDLEKTCCDGTTYQDIPRKQLTNFFVEASTSKEGLDESFILQQIEQRLAEDIFQDKINVKSSNIDVNVLNEIEKIKNELGGGDDDCSRIDKRKRDDKIQLNDEESSVEDSDLPLEKRIRTENWAKRYEKQLVFGPDNFENCGETNSDDHLNDIIKSPLEQSTKQEIENKSIFTYSENTAGPSNSYGQ